MSDYYQSHPSGIEAIEITQYESFLRGNIIKYIMRAPYKGSELEDLEKAAQYLQWEIERVKEEMFWDQFDNTVVKDRLEELKEMRDEWDSEENIGYVADNWDYYHAGVTIGTGVDVTRRVARPFEKNFDDVVFPEKCQECDGACKVC